LGALLRIAHEEFTGSMLLHLRSQGIELSVTEYRVLRYPGPDGVRPIELAERCNLTRQAMNYTLAGLEQRGLIERRVAPGRSTRLVFATARGWEVFNALRIAVDAVERDWVKRFGKRQVASLHGILLDIAIGLGKVDAPPAS
jgi:DNA-binding MarR family transcriptional regulator